MSNKIREQVKKVRRDYDYSSLDESNLFSNPIEQLKSWLKEALDANVLEPNAFNLSTAANNQPDNRIVLCRDVQDRGISFYTNYTSKKARDIVHNNKVAVNFFWPEMDRQIRISGEVEQLSHDESNDYFASRPRASQIGAWASYQSDELSEREVLEKTVRDLEKEFENKEIPRPDFWGGYLIKPNIIEFWQGRLSRLHDRLCFTKQGDSWKISRLYP